MNRIQEVFAGHALELVVRTLNVAGRLTLQARDALHARAIRLRIREHQRRSAPVTHVHPNLRPGDPIAVLRVREERGVHWHYVPVSRDVEGAPHAFLPDGRRVDLKETDVCRFKPEATP